MADPFRRAAGVPLLALYAIALSACGGSPSGPSSSTPALTENYRDRAHLRALTGRYTNGFAEPGTTRFHTIWQIDNHEGVHTLVILQIGHPPALFNEGVAVAHQTEPAQSILTPRWNGTDLHVLARQDRRRRTHSPAVVPAPQHGLLWFRRERDVSVRGLVRPLSDRHVRTGALETVLCLGDVRRHGVGDRVARPRSVRAQPIVTLERLADVGQIGLVSGRAYLRVSSWLASLSYPP